MQRLLEKTLPNLRIFAVFVEPLLPPAVQVFVPSLQVSAGPVQVPLTLPEVCNVLA